MNKISISRRLGHWLFLMQEFDLTIVDRTWKATIVADFLSCLHVLEDLTIIDDRFLDENMLFISTQNPWYVDIANYLTIGRTSTHFSTKEHKFLVEKSSKFSCITSCMFDTRPNQVMN